MMKHKFIALAFSVPAAITFAATAVADHCPTSLHHNHKGYWTSNDSPGWKSIKPTKHGDTLAAKNFGGAVYSPLKKRIACVYKSKSGQWIALLSSLSHPINEDDLNMKVWKYMQKNNFYLCGTPRYKLKDCTFKIK